MSRTSSSPNHNPRSRPVLIAVSGAGSTPSAKPSLEPSASVASSVPPLSLLTILTKPTTDGYPATEVIKFLLEIVGRDVMSFRSNAQMAHMLVDRARDICDAINTHIKKTETGTGTDLDWISFAKFSDAIDPAEE